MRSSTSPDTNKEKIDWFPSRMYKDHFVNRRIHKFMLQFHSFYLSFKIFSYLLNFLIV